VGSAVVGVDAVDPPLATELKLIEKDGFVVLVGVVVVVEAGVETLVVDCEVSLSASEEVVAVATSDLDSEATESSPFTATLAA